MNPNPNQPYKSIFARKEKPEKGNRFYTQSITEVTEIMKRKKIKRDSDEEGEEDKQKKFELFETVNIEVADHKTLEKLSAFAVVQKVLQWIYLKDFTNPLWISINNKHLIQNVVFLVVNGLGALRAESYISKDIAPFLEKKMNNESRCYMKGSQFFHPNNERFWELFFSSKHINADNIKKKKVRNLNPNGDSDKPQTYEELLLQKYESNILNKEDLQINLYPMDDLPVYMDYIRTATQQPPETKQSIKDMILGLDCEMVRTVQGLELARLTLINFEYQVLYDEFVKPDNHIEDYLTKYSGVTVEHMENATKRLKDVQQDFLKFCNANTILVGHSLENDLHSLKIVHNRVIDTSVLYQNAKGYKTSLKNLAYTNLHIEIQKGTHDSAEDSKAALALAKFKIEILDNFESYQDKKKMEKLDILENIFSSGKTVLPLDETPYIDPLLRYAISYDELRKSEFDEVTLKMYKWLKMKGPGVPRPPSIITGVIRNVPAEQNIQDDKDIDQGVAEFFRKLDKRCQEIVEVSEKNTVFLLVFCDCQDVAQKKYEAEVKKQSDKDARPFVSGQDIARKMQSLGLFFAS